MRSFTKSSNGDLDYTEDWADWLGSDTILTSTWVVGAGLTGGAESNTTTLATIFLSGGTRGASYVVTNQIDTNQLRTAERSFLLRIIDK